MLKTIGIWRILTSSIKATFELAVNHFWKSFSVKPTRLAATENKISRNSFQFDQNLPHLTRKSFYIFILPSNRFLPRAKERESQRKKELSEPKERASQRKNDPNADQWANQTPISEPNADPPLRSKRRFRHEPNADPNADPATIQMPIQSANQTPISSHSGHAKLTSPPILHGSPITEL